MHSRKYPLTYHARKYDMNALLKEFSEKITSRKSYWIPLLFYTFGAYGFSMLNRTVGADDLATPLYVDSTVWLAELRWGAVLWKKLFSFGACVPFLDKYLSICFLMLAGTAFACILYQINGKRDRVWLYTIAACSFITFPIICEIWEFTCGGTIIVPGDYFCCFMLILWLLTCRTDSFPSQTRKLFTAGILLAPVISSAESIAPVYITAVLIILFYRHCLRRVDPDRKSAWFFEGIRFAIPLFIAFILRLLIGYGIMAALHLKHRHTGATSIAWPLSGEELAALFKGVLVDYGVAALVNLPITIFIVCAVLFAIRCFVLAFKNKTVLPVFLGICIGISLFLITIIQGSVMYYRTAITLMVFCAFVFYLHAENFYDLINSGILKSKRFYVLAGRCGLVLLLFITWRQAAHLHRYLALNNQRYDNEAAVMQQLGYRLTDEYDTSKPMIFVGDFSNGNASYAATHDMAEKWNGRLFRKIRKKIDGTEDWKAPMLVQTTVSSAIDWYHWEFDGQLMDEFFAYYGYDFDVTALSRSELEPYNEEARELGMTTYDIVDRGDYLLICLGRLD